MRTRPIREHEVCPSWVVAVILLFLLVTAISARAAGGLSDLTNGPLIRLEDRRWDFGPIAQEIKVTHEFRFRNDGTAPLRISKVESDCGCTVGVLQDSLLIPGQASAVKVTLDPGNYEGDLQKVIALYTNDPAEPRIDLVLTALVKPCVQTETKELDFGQVKRGEIRTVSTRLSVEAGTDFRVTGVHGGEDRVSWTFRREPSDAGETYLVTAQLRPDAPVGIFSDRIEVQVQHPKIKMVRISTRGDIYSYFHLSSDRIAFEPVPAGRTQAQTLLIEADGKEPYEITSATSPTPYLETDLRKEGKGYRLTVTLRAPRRAVKFREKIILKTTDPMQPEIKIDTRGIVVEPS